MTRTRLPTRRLSETVALTFAGTAHRVTIGFFPDGRPGEVFADGGKPGSMIDALLADASVAVSLLLQHGVEPAALAHSLGRLGDGTSPASILGALADLLVEAAGESVDSSQAVAAIPLATHPLPRLQRLPEVRETASVEPGDGTQPFPSGMAFPARAGGQEQGVKASAATPAAPDASPPSFAPTAHPQNGEAD